MFHKLFFRLYEEMWVFVHLCCTYRFGEKRTLGRFFTSDSNSKGK